MAEYGYIIRGVRRSLHRAVGERTYGHEEFGTFLDLYGIAEAEDGCQIVIVIVLEVTGFDCSRSQYGTGSAIFTYSVDGQRYKRLGSDGGYRSKVYGNAVYGCSLKCGFVLLGKFVYIQPIGTGIIAIPSELDFFELGVFFAADVPDILGTTGLYCILQNIIGLSGIILGGKANADSAFFDKCYCWILLGAGFFVCILEYPFPFGGMTLREVTEGYGNVERQEYADEG